MNEIIINNISETKMIFHTLSKSRVVDIFNYRCKSVYVLNEEDLLVENGKLVLSIDLKSWDKCYPEIDFYNVFESLDKIVPSEYKEKMKNNNLETKYNFLNVLESLKRITNPKGGTPITCIKATLIGYDNILNKSFTFESKFVNGKHAIVGLYEDGRKVIYKDSKLYEL